MADIPALCIVVFIVAAIAVLALWTVARQEREIARLKRELRKDGRHVGS